ncbi:hypothetical protein [Paenibacillus dakarensis]|uniref:hypothetical protein n=1 Tax=Paenibacillus dakarensis TaxID=1527293 RepID=UPI0006D59DB7|nr:hypothetical protein [Paenibacillus dakarensis]
MKKTRLIISLLLGLIISSCSSGESQNNSQKEPLPPSPFPIELSTQFSVFKVDVSKQEAANKLIMTVNRNAELHSNVILQYRMYPFIEGNKVEQLAKNILDEDIDLYVKKEIIEDIPLTEYGKYRIEIEAHYDGWGQNKTYTIQFDDNGVSILHES